METSPSRDDLVELVERLVAQERKLHEVLDDESDLDLDRVDDLLGHQAGLLRFFEHHTDLLRSLLQDGFSDFRDPARKFQELREETMERMENLKGKWSDQIDALEDTEKLVDRYYQGERRTGEGTNQRFHDMA